MARLKACLRCASTDLAVAGAGDGVHLEGGQLAVLTCRACGLTSAPMEFDDLAAYGRFREERAALFRAPSAPPAPTLELEALPPSPPTMVRGWVRGAAAVVGFVFVLAGALSLFTAIQMGGEAWGALLPSAVFALLMGAPMLALAANRR